VPHDRKNAYAIRKRVLAVVLSFAAASSLAAGCGLDEGGFAAAPNASPGGSDTDAGGSHSPDDSGAPGEDSASQDHDAGACAACPPQTACVANACALARRVFVSSTLSTADLGGPTGADTKCQNLADAMRLGGNWRAWLSDQLTSPALRFVKANVPYRLLDGTLVANDWDDLTDGVLAHGIDHDEKGILANDAEVWTGTTATGAASGNHCSGFTSDVSQPATVGITTLPADWTSRYTQFCNRTNVRVYCFEQ